MSLRVYVHLVDRDGHVSEPFIAFIDLTFSWNQVLKECIDCIYEKEIENLTSIDYLNTFSNFHLLQLPNNDTKWSNQEDLIEIYHSYQLQDNCFYLFCPSDSEYEMILKLHDPNPITDDSCHNPVEPLKALSYYFNKYGQLGNKITNQLVKDIFEDPLRVTEMDEIIKAATYHIQMKMLSELNFKHVLIPLQINSDMEPRCSIFITENWRHCSQLLIVINGGLSLDPGIWSRDLLIQRGIDEGSMLPVFKRAQQENYGILVLNPYTNSGTIRNESQPIRYSSTPDEHIVYVWDTIIQKSKCKQLFILGYKFAGNLVKNLLLKRPISQDRIHAIALIEGAYRLIGDEPMSLIRVLQNRMVNFKSDMETIGNRLPLLEKKLGCICISVGSVSNGKDHQRSSSNKALSIGLALNAIFEYFQAVATENITSTMYFTSKRHSTFRKLFRLPSKTKEMKQTKSEFENHDEMYKKTLSSVKLEDFNLLKVIGKGSIGKVFMVRKLSNDQIYAMKVLKKASVLRNDLENYIQTERLILEEIDHPFIARLRYSFQTSNKLYLVTDYCSGGELFHHLSEDGFSLEQARFYCAEIVLGIEHLHKMNVAYRDLKPENILIEASGHLRITDFGLSKTNVVNDHGANTLVGSEEYLAPEVYNMQQYGSSVDWWSLGILLYEMIVGRHPFEDENHKVKLKNVMIPGYIRSQIPDTMPDHAASLICGLVEHDPSKRLGSNGAQEIRDHPFFVEMNWELLLKKHINPPWKPTVVRDSDVGNFDPEFTSLPVEDSVSTQQSVMTCKTFDDFTFDPYNGTLSA